MADSNQIIPDGVDIVVARLAVAWDMVRLAYDHQRAGGGASAGSIDPEQRIKQMTNAVIRVNQALSNMKEMTG